MPNIDKLLEQNNAGFKRYTGIYKATFYEMLEVTPAVKSVQLNLGDLNQAA